MKKFFIILMSIVLVLSSSVFAYAADNDNGFVNNQNNKARLYNGFYYEDLYLVMKWSKDWTPMADQPVGAWCTNHFTWYADNYDEDSWYGYDDMTTFGEGTYKIEDFLKIMRVGDDPDMWAKYSAAGAYDAGWGLYTNGTPKYIVYQDVINVFDSVTGELVYSTDLVGSVNKGLGKPVY